MLPCFLVSVCAYFTDTSASNCPTSFDSWSRHPRLWSRPDRRSELRQPPLCGLRLRRRKRVDEGRSAPPSRHQNQLLCWQWDHVHTTRSQFQPRHLPVPSEQPGQRHDSHLQSNRQLWVRSTHWTLSQGVYSSVYNFIVLYCSCEQTVHITWPFWDRRQQRRASGWRCSAARTLSQQQTSAGPSTTPRPTAMAPCTSSRGWRQRALETTPALPAITWPWRKTRQFFS